MQYCVSSKVNIGGAEITINTPLTTLALNYIGIGQLLTITGDDEDLQRLADEINAHLANKEEHNGKALRD